MGIFGNLFNKKIIIGIHGLSNKPPKALQKKWWIKSIKEGLATIGHPDASFVFKSVYWADILYEHPEDPHEDNKKSPFYLDEPYLPGDPKAYGRFKISNIKKKLLDIIDKKIDNLFLKETGLINFDKIADMFIRNMYKDLYFYYNSESTVEKFKGQPVRNLICNRLVEVLHKYRNKQILLIGHSMGTIISYDVLTRYVPDIKIHTFVTIGSPLGLPIIIKKIFSEQGNDLRKEKEVTAPENIQYKWYNFSDLDDPVAIDYNLSNDYKKNSSGVGPEDKVVYNNYEFNGKRNAHKLYGYLRAPEVAEVIYDFCKSKKPGIYLNLKKKLLSFRGRKSNKS